MLALQQLLDAFTKQTVDLDRINYLLRVLSHLGEVHLLCTPSYSLLLPCLLSELCAVDLKWAWVPLVRGTAKLKF